MQEVVDGVGVEVVVVVEGLVRLRQRRGDGGWTLKLEKRH